MPGFAHHARHAVLILLFMLCAAGAGTALAAIVTQSDSQSAPASASPFDAAPTGVESLISETEFVKNPELAQAVARGQWTAACGMATDILAQKQVDLDALGVFAICAAIRNDKEATKKSLLRLNEAESAPRYYAQLAQGIEHLRNRSPDKAGAVFTSVLQQRSGDPLALYFAGEALHAQGKDADAMSSFRSSLAVWPDHAPALAAVGRISTAGNASKGTLQAAIAMVERAARIEPTNRAYWQQLVDLCERAGEHGRANGIRLQWLTRRIPN